MPDNISELYRLEEFKQLVKDIIIPCNGQVNRCVKQAWQSVQIEWEERSLDEIIQIRSKHNFSPTKYYDLATSIQIAKTLLLCQYGRKKVAKRFILQVYAVLKKIFLKRNTLAIIGQAGDGKEFFLPTIFTLVWNVGYVDGNSNFNCQDLLNRSLGVVEHFKFKPPQIGRYKNVFAGRGSQIKYRNEWTTLRRIPIIITSNNRFIDQLDYPQAFEQRMFINYWQPQPWLDKLSKRLHPLILPHLAKESFQNVLSVSEVVSLAEPNYDTPIYKMLQHSDSDSDADLDSDSDLERDLQLVEC